MCLSVIRDHAWSVQVKPICKLLAVGNIPDILHQASRAGNAIGKGVWGVDDWKAPASSRVETKRPS